MTRMVVFLSESERQALTEMSQKEMRWPRDQVRFILRQALVECGLLQASDYEEAESPSASGGGIVAMCASDDRLYITNGADIFFTDDDGATWRQIEVGIIWPSVSSDRRHCGRVQVENLLDG